MGARPQDVMPIPSATVGMNTVLRSWQRRFAAPGSQTRRGLCLSIAYGSNKKILRQIAEESGCHIDEAQVNFPLEDEEQLLQTLRESLRADTSLIVLDVIPSNAPVLLPMERVVPLCRELAPEAFILADAAHGLFSLPLKLSGPGAMGVDALVTNCHKWFCGPKGTAALFVSPDHQHWIQPLVISHGYGTDFPSGFYWPGLSDFSSWLALDEALAFWDLVGMHPARTYCNYLVTDAAEMLAEAWGTHLGIPVELLGPMALVQLPELPMLQSAGKHYSYEHAEAVQNALFETFKIEVPVKALSGNLYVRISAHIYNHIEEYEVLRDAMLELRAGDRV
eukprot:TRINITY_DN63150_c0_g1_i1.p1 TRINITY_DN63150_c0_g1~~TRINITY_DN63150_c0_g1_i1.p1  ORF type:complete len:336 (-),score=49.20 TRINITY_DN63150_c0_g1_i1:69-1076(-)